MGKDFENRLKEYLENTPDVYIDGWDEELEDWEKYTTKITSEEGLPLEDNKDKESWVKKEKTDLKYLPNFLLTNSFFSGISAGNSEHYMIYHSIGDKREDKEYKSNKYFCKYLSNDIKECYVDSTEAITKAKDSDNNIINHYRKISNLLKDIVAANEPNDVYTCEQNEIYDGFSAIQLLRKMTILESMMLSDDKQQKKHPDLYNKFLWVCTAESLYKAAEDLGVDIKDKKTFFEINQAVYSEMKEEYVKVKKEMNTESKGEDGKELNANNMTREQIVELYDFVCKVYFAKYNKLFTDFYNTNVIFNGAPGTGKTYSVSADIKSLNDSNPGLYNKPTMIQFHPSYTYQDFIEGIKPTGIDDKGNIKLELVNGSFKQFCIDVRTQNEKTWKALKLNDNNNKGNRPNKDNPKTLERWPHYYFIVDEINRGNLSNIFGETFTLLEYRDYDFSGNDGEYSQPDNNNDINTTASLAETASSNIIKKYIEDQKDNVKNLYYKKINKGNDDYDVKFGIPFNIHFIGMMNDVDRSIDSFDLAFRRRFYWQPMYCDYEAIYNTLIKKSNDSKWQESVKSYVVSCMQLNYYITGEEPLNKPSEVGFDKPKNTSIRSYGRTYEIGQGYFIRMQHITGKKEIKKEHKERLFDNYIAGTIKEYIRQMEDEENIIDKYLKEAKNAFCKEPEN